MSQILPRFYQARVDIGALKQIRAEVAASARFVPRGLPARGGALVRHRTPIPKIMVPKPPKPKRPWWRLW